MIYLQDGLLPSYYPSAYLKYRIWASKYYIWNKISAGIFIRHSLDYEIWECFKKIPLPLINNTNITIKNIVFLASGAGDWTALKNRSDEDLAFLALMEAAKANPNIKFVFRPHPLWMHHEHQGINSIQRLFDYALEINLPNFAISGGAFEEGKNFTKNSRLSFAPTTINDDIATSDMVLGDHSQALITAAQKGKIIASLSLARRKEFFCDYAKLGFPVLRSTEEINDLIKKLQKGKEFILNYNKAIELYNKEIN